MTPEQLRASILQYAMEGKLVKQDPNDELASELLKKIKKKRAALTKEGQIKKSKKLPVITDEEKLFDIPDSWEWARVGTLFSVNDRNKADDTLIAGFLPMKNIDDGYSNTYAVNDREWKDIKSGYTHIRQGDIILAKITPCFQNRKSCVITKLPNGIGAATTEVYALNPIIPEFSKLYIYFFKSQLFIQEGMKKFTGSAGQQRVPRKYVENFVMPLPPLEEQKRIVAKIEKLMPLVDEYAESYNRLQKIDNEFEDKLKQSVLQYAMEGKLVKQNPSDEPASELIKKIENEKAELVKEGKIKKNKKLLAITDDEKQFDIPNGWEWVKLGNIVDYVQRGKSPKYDKESTRYPIISQKCVQWDGIHLEFAKHLKEDFWEGLPSYRFVTKGDLLLNSTGTGTVGRVIKVTEPFNKVPVDSHVTVIRLNQNICNSYILYFLMSPIIQKNLDDYLTGTTKQKEFGLASIQNIVVSLPPLEEQKRIVAKLREFKRSADILSK